MSATRNTPALMTNVSWTFPTVADMKASTELRAGDSVVTQGYYSATDEGGATFTVLTSAAYGGVPDGFGDHAITSTVGGALVAQQVLKRPVTARRFGATGLGVANDRLAVQAWINRLCTAAGAAVGFFNPQVVLDGGGLMYAVDDTLSIPTRRNVVVRDLHLISIGTGWTSSKFAFVNNSSWSRFENVTVDCNAVSNGVQENGGRNRWYAPMIVRMSPTWASFGMQIPEAGAGDVRIDKAWISQWIMSDPEWSIKAKRTATLLHVRNSDCKIHDSNLNWGATCYNGGSGVHLLYNCHLVNTKSPTMDVDPATFDFELVRWGEGGLTGEICLHQVYLDNGQSNFYNDRATGSVEPICNTGDKMFGAFLNFWSNGSAEPRHDLLIKPKGLDGLVATSNKLVAYPNTGGAVPNWDAAVQTMADNFNSAMTDFGGEHRNSGRLMNSEKRIEANLNSSPFGTFSTKGINILQSYGVYMTPQDYPQTGANFAIAKANTAWLTATANAIGDVVVNASNFYVATTAGTTGATAPTHTTGTVSDGGVSWKYLQAVSGFGTAGAGAYSKTGATWGPVGSNVGGGVLSLYGTGTPEGAVSAPIGSEYHRTDGGAGTSFYVKESGGGGNTGWVAK